MLQADQHVGGQNITAEGTQRARSGEQQCRCAVSVDDRIS